MTGSSQQFTDGAISEGIFVEIFAETLRKIREILQTYVVLYIRKDCGNSVQSLWKSRGNFQTNFCNYPFPNDPISELLILRGWVHMHVRGNGMLRERSISFHAVPHEHLEDGPNTVSESTVAIPTAIYRSVQGPGPEIWARLRGRN